MDCIKNSANLNQLWSNIIVEELVRHQINYFCISPGSRSAPLTVAAARHSKVLTKIVYDERSAAFQALGYARATRRPAVLICTSGTALANCYPAIIEAFQENLPVIILSADRPPELQNRGANQTIDQKNIFGKFTKHNSTLSCPSIEKEPMYILQEINEAIQKAIVIDAGPVHINCMFREPLAPSKEPCLKNYLNEVRDWLSAEEPYIKVKKKNWELKNSQINDVIKLINKNSGIILAGRNENIDDKQAILDLAEKIGWPVFADITSGLRLNADSDKIVHYFDQLLLSGKIKNKIKDLPILHFGGQMVSKRLLKFLGKHNGIHIHILETDKIVDPANSVTMRIRYSISGFISHILLKVNGDSGLKIDFQRYSMIVNNCISAYSASDDEKIDEISVVQIISRDIFNESALFIASSMPIRDMDMFAVPGKNNVVIGANRGVSGIDGTIASSIGFANGLKKALTLIIGDLAFLHDLNSLSLIKDCEQPLLIVVINNQGGGIFSFLPIAEHDDVFEKNFATPHNYSFNKVAEMFGLKYFNPKTKEDFASLYSQYQYSKKPTLIEVRTDRAENLKLHTNLQKQILSNLP